MMYKDTITAQFQNRLFQRGSIIEQLSNPDVTLSTTPQYVGGFARPSQEKRKAYEQLYEDQLRFLMAVAYLQPHLESGGIMSVKAGATCLFPYLNDILDRAEKLLGIDLWLGLYPRWEDWRKLASGFTASPIDKHVLSTIVTDMDPAFHGITVLWHGHPEQAAVDKVKELSRGDC